MFFNRTLAALGCCVTCLALSTATAPAATRVMFGNAYSTGLTVLHSFQSAGGDLGYPYGNLVEGPAGAFYGLADSRENGAPDSGGCGSMFKLSPPPAPGGKWSEKILFAFSGDVCYPQNLVYGSDRALYGVTDSATAFRLAPPSQGGTSWTIRVIAEFGSNDGPHPAVGRDPSALLAGSDGSFYGATEHGGKYGGGTVFRLTPPGSGSQAWTTTVLHRFGSDSVVCAPEGGLAMDATGALYGFAAGCGPQGMGGVFRLTEASSGAWTPTLLASFNYLAPGGIPVFDAAGDIYGIAVGADPSTGIGDFMGSVFELVNEGGGAYTTSVLFSYNYYKPYKYFLGVALSPAGVLYGAASGVSPDGNGNRDAPGFLWSLGPGSTGAIFTKLHDFGTGKGGRWPSISSLFIGAKGDLYGVCLAGGEYDQGTVFRYVP